MPTRDATDPSDREVAIRLRVASLNLWSGRSRGDGRAHPELLARAIADLDADVLAIQEVDRAQARSGDVDQAALVADALGAVWHRHVDTVIGTPGAHRWRAAADAVPNLDPRPNPDPAPDAASPDAPGGYGIALLSRLPVAGSDVLRLDTARHGYPALVARPRPRALWLQDEPRAAVRLTLQAPQLTIACTHLSVLPDAGTRQLRQVTAWLAERPGPALLLGDLNLPRTLARRLTRWTPLLSAATFPARRPVVQLDNVLARGLPPGTRASGRVVLLPVSDHRGVLVDLELPDGGSSPPNE